MRHIVIASFGSAHVLRPDLVRLPLRSCSRTIGSWRYRKFYQALYMGGIQQIMVFDRSYKAYQDMIRHNTLYKVSEAILLMPLK